MAVNNPILIANLWLVPYYCTLLIFLTLAYKHNQKVSKEHAHLLNTQILYALLAIAASKFDTSQRYGIHEFQCPLFYTILTLGTVCAWSLTIQLTSGGVHQKSFILHYLWPCLLPLLSIEWKLPVVLSLIPIYIYGYLRLRQLHKHIHKFRLVYMLFSLLSIYPFMAWLATDQSIDWLIDVIPYLWAWTIVIEQTVLVLLLLNRSELKSIASFEAKESYKTAPAAQIQAIETKTTDVQSSEMEQTVKAAFEAYMLQQKPYLNPELKITDLITELPFQTNRQYLSGFINREYNMNFRSYINFLRMQEMEELRKLSKSRPMNEVELALAAGFPSYRSYLYYCKQQELKTKESEEA
ncbi:MAG: hypothetical protein LBN24_09945 [Mediterranea sp.]|jgi:AraC-like DNA-binding protein|nr:hypothetical protein [Mediterranea sp.]